MAIDAFRYDGKRVLVVGGATGMGAAAKLARHRLRRHLHAVADHLH